MKYSELELLIMEILSELDKEDQYNKERYGECGKCGCALHIPYYFTDKDTKVNYMGDTVVKYYLRAENLLCDACGNKVIIDGSFDYEISKERYDNLRKLEDKHLC